MPSRLASYISIFTLVGLTVLFGCSAPRSSQKSIPSPTAVLNETKVDGPLASERERSFLICRRDQSCDRLHFLTALTALHGNPESAVSHFREVITIAPDSNLASLSASWLKNLAGSSKLEDGVVTQTNEWLLVELLGRERMMRHELHLRDKKLEELSKQLNALKQINLEMKGKSYLMKPRIKTIPAPDMAH